MDRDITGVMLRFARKSVVIMYPQLKLSVDCPFAVGSFAVGIREYARLQTEDVVFERYADQPNSLYQPA
jgi:hypothetical protein